MFTEKLIKPLSSALIEAGITTPLPLQEKAISKLNAGQDMFGIGSTGIGKTTTAIIATIQKLKEEFEDAPRALIIVATHERALTMKDQFRTLGKNTSLRYACAIEGIKIEKQFEEIYFGTDVIIGTTKRIMDIYFKHGLNYFFWMMLNLKLKMLSKAMLIGLYRAYLNVNISFLLMK
jgi:ATP-dependent RNA helicase RhlE